MSDTATDLAEKLDKEGRKTIEFFSGLSRDAWDAQVYEDGAAWNVRLVLIHITETEFEILQLIQSIVEGGPGVPEGFDLDAHNLQQVAQAAASSPAEWLALFSQRRATTIAFVRGLDAADLARRGRHPFLGVAEVVEMIRLMYLHLQLHQRDVRRALQG